MPDVKCGETLTKHVMVCGDKEQHEVSSIATGLHFLSAGCVNANWVAITIIDYHTNTRETIDQDMKALNMTMARVWS